jgi:hypothetical protein
MVDPGIKKIKIPFEEFPLVQFSTVFNPTTSREEVDFLYYDFRYRVISEDKNRFSHWSSIQRNIQPDITTPFPYTEAQTNRFSVTKSGEIITAIWSFPGDSEIEERTSLDPANPNYMSPEEANYIKIFRRTRTYDVWARWNNNNTTNLNDSGWTPWEFETSVSANSFSILKKDGDVKRIEIAIQVPTTIKLRDYNNNKLTLFRGLSGTI